MIRAFSSNAAMASLVLAIVVSTPATAQVESGNEQLFNLVSQMQQLQDEIRSLRGQIEEQSYQIEDLKRRQRDQYLDLDQRISGITGGQPSGAAPGLGSTTRTAPSTAAGVTASATVPAASPATGGNAAVPPLGRTEEGEAAAQAAASQPPRDVPEVTAPPSVPSTTMALGAPDTTSRETVANPEAEQAAYDQAFQALKELRYADAARDFQAFLDAYPQSSLAGNAQYWLGESYYVTRNYDMALNAFESLGSNYPDSTKGGDALLKIGYTHYELKQYDQARAALEQVTTRYPNSTLARLATSRLNSMRLEGHL
ncbi:tol-pal system protein YbgF [Marinihelvus fidelis]|uniref:Cell division coordinator CpoB n=1 Tax=Marinihelvus fidelis TaxID=2613842 RepID=A0A5N0TEG5_9GAMM|nr:tol-pal system protein YbgF [Marinihelvus fidelis]KAA9133493.1 tol-pal system protein YbgF [Marinihelvus fidelis]